MSNLGDALKVLGPGSVSLNLKKVECGHLDFSGLDLKGSSFSQAEIAHCLFVGTTLVGCDMIGAKFSHCDFVGGELQGSTFTRALFNHCSFSHSDFGKSYFVEAHFKEVDFMGASLCGAVLWNADIMGANNLKRKNFFDPESSGKKPKTYLSETNTLMANESYRNLKRYFYQKGLTEDASWAAYRELTMERKHFFETKDIRFVPSLFMDILSGYTEKPVRVILSSLGIVLIFGFAYFLLDAVRPTVENSEGPVGFWNSIYFSFITFTTVGFGDFIPKTFLWVKILVAMEAFSGPFMAGLFIFTLTRRYAAG